MNQIGFKSIFLDVVDSTNNYVANLVKTTGIAHGTVIMADEQTNGRGQRGTNWQTQAGMNLIFSLFVEFNELEIEHQDAIHHWVSISVLNALNKIGIKAQIKWPNDILTKNGKLAGILIENSVSNQFVKHAIVGIGLNVNQVEFQDVRATSIRLETGAFFNVREFSFMLIASLNDHWKRVHNRDFVFLKSDYLSQLWGMNETVRFLRDGQEEQGQIMGTNPVGLLQMKTNRGEEVFDLKDIKFIID